MIVDTSNKHIHNIIDISFSNDKLVAYLHFNLVVEGFSFTLNELEDLIHSKGIIYGIDREKCAAIANDPGKFLYDKTIIAIGDKVQHGIDGYIKHAMIAKQSKQEHDHHSLASIDHKQVHVLDNVKKGQLIAEKIPPVKGKAGRTVTGKIVMPRNGLVVNFKLGKNVVADENKMKLYAAIDGLVSITSDGKTNVFPIYEVNGDVDYRIGNIDFVGTVIIRGNVLTGFQVKASGDIRVIGGVEGADLLADGSIEITEGIMGNNKGLIKAGHDVKTSFILEGNVEASNDIIVSQSIMHSQIRAGRHVICDGKGLIVGGLIQAGMDVTARTIGNASSTATTIEVGLLPDYRSKLIELRELIQVEQSNLDKTLQALNLLDQLALQGKLDDNKRSLRQKLTNTKRASEQEITEVKNDIFHIEKMLEDIGEAKIEVKGMIYGGTKIVIGRNTRHIKDALKRLCFSVVDGDISMKAIV